MQNKMKNKNNRVKVKFLGTKIVDGILMYCSRFSVKLNNKFITKK